MVMVTTFDPSIGKATQWKKGCASPNPGGRPRTRVLSEALRNKLAEVNPDDPEGRTYAEIVAENPVAVACGRGAGAVNAANEIANRCEGRVSQKVEIADFTREIE